MLIVVIESFHEFRSVITNFTCLVRVPRQHCCSGKVSRNYESFCQPILLIESVWYRIRFIWKPCKLVIGIVTNKSSSIHLVADRPTFQRQFESFALQLCGSFAWDQHRSSQTKKQKKYRQPGIVWFVFQKLTLLMHSQIHESFVRFQILLDYDQQNFMEIRGCWIFYRRRREKTESKTEIRISLDER